MKRKLLPWTRQPQYLCDLVSLSAPALGVFLPTSKLDPITKQAVSFVAEASYGVGSSGAAYKTTVGTVNARATLAPAASITIPTAAYSVLIYMRHFADGTGEGVGFRPVTTLAGRAAPNFSGGSALWDFGGATEGATRLTATGAYENNGDAVALLFTVGPRGMEAWRNGSKIASNAATPTRSGAYDFVAGDCYGGTSGNTEFYLIVPFNGQLKTPECEQLSKYPFSVFAPQSRNMFTAAGGTQSYSYTASGGLTFGGTASPTRNRVPSPAGGAVFGGVAVQTRNRTPSPAGGAVFGGTAVQTRNRTPSPAGGAVFGGHAAYTTSGTQTFTYVAVGGITLSGSATKLRGRAMSLGGGLLFGGAANLSKGKSLTPTGGVTLSGAATRTRGVTPVPAGGLHLAGTASAYGAFFQLISNLVRNVFSSRITKRASLSSSIIRR